MADKITDGAHVSPETENGVYDFVSTRDVAKDGSIDFVGALKTSVTSYAELVRHGCRPRIGDVLFSKDGTVGRTARVRDERKFVVASSLIIIRPAPMRLDYNYLHFLFKHSRVVQQIDSFVKGAGLPRISIASLKRVSGPFPSLSTQRELAETFDVLERSIAMRDEQLRRSIELLTEYKTSLITAAVTGELDVTTAGSGIPA